MYAISKTFPLHSVSDEYITDKVQNQFVISKKMSLNHSRNTGIYVINAEAHADIKAIKLSDTDNVVVVGTDVNLLILLSKRSHHKNA